MLIPSCQAKPHMVYWGRLPTFDNPFREGYIGVTTLKLHARVALHFSSPTNHALKEALAEHGKEIEWHPLHADLPWNVAYQIERIYRPKPYIGWNAGFGGSRYKKRREGWLVIPLGSSLLESDYRTPWIIAPRPNNGYTPRLAQCKS